MPTINTTTRLAAAAAMAGASLGTIFARKGTPLTTTAEPAAAVVSTAETAEEFAARRAKEEERELYAPVSSE